MSFFICVSFSKGLSENITFKSNVNQTCLLNIGLQFAQKVQNSLQDAYNSIYTKPEKRASNIWTKLQTIDPQALYAHFRTKPRPIRQCLNLPINK